MLAMTGSVMTAATRPAWRSRQSARSAASFHAQRTVSATDAVGQALRVEHPRRVGRIAERGRVARMGAHEKRVVPAVVVALELDDQRPAGHAPGRS